MTEVLKVKKLYKDSKIPTKAFLTDSGFDLYYYGSSSIVISPGCRRLVPTGIAISLPNKKVTIDGMDFVYEAQVRPRSGYAIKKGLGVLNSPGTVDNGFTGQIQVIVVNTNNTESDGNGDSKWPEHNIITIEPGDKIAQLCISLVALPKLVEVEELEDSERGSAGFGSTGK
jgi:dUTP pyrophosphatase